jgi:fumarate reductase subunit D
MSCCHGRCGGARGVGLIVLGVLVLGLGMMHRYHHPCHSERVERHIAEVCLKAAEGVHR